MANHIGPSPSAVAAMRDAATAERLGPYSPDLDGGLRGLVAERLLGRARDEDFEVIGTEGAQAGVGYSALACLNPGDEVIATDPGYFHFVPAFRLAGATPVFVRLGAANGWRLDPDEVAAAVTERTKMIVVCGSRSTRSGPCSVARSWRRCCACRPSAGSCCWRIPPTRRIASIQMPGTITCRRWLPGYPEATVLESSGFAHGYGLAGARGGSGALGGPPDLVRACLQVKIAVVRLNTSTLAQAGAMAALGDEEWLRHGEGIVRANLASLKQVAQPVVDPEYGFSCVVDCSAWGPGRQQELTVALCKRKVAVYPG